jgi:hypothetical protein
VAQKKKKRRKLTGREKRKVHGWFLEHLQEYSSLEVHESDKYKYILKGQQINWVLEHQFDGPHSGHQSFCSVFHLFHSHHQKIEADIPLLFSFDGFFKKIQ